MRKIVPVLLCAFVLVMAESAWVGPAMPDKPMNNPNISKLAKPRTAEAAKILTRKSAAQAPAIPDGFSVAPGKPSPLASRERVLEPVDNPDETLYFDTRIYSALGLTAGGTFWTAVRFTPAVGCTLKAIRFYQWDATAANGYVYVFAESLAYTPKRVPLESVPYTGAGSQQWKTISLTTPLVMASGHDFWIGVKSTHTAGQYPMGFDYAPPGVSQRSMWYSTNLISWTDLSSVYGAWNLQAIVASLPYGDDMAAMSIDELTSPKVPNQWLTLKATVKNVGTNSRSPGVRTILRIAGPSYSYSDTALTTTTIVPNGTEQVTWSPNWRIPATLGIYTLTVFTDLSGDQNRANDTTRYTLEVTNWLTYADWNSPYWFTWTGPEKGVVFDPSAFGVQYPVQIESLKAYFYLGGSHPWRDSTFQFKVFSGDLSTLLYASPLLEASAGSGIYKYAIPSGSRPTVTSGSYLVTVDCYQAASDSSPDLLADNNFRYRSVYGDSTQWYYWSNGEFYISSFVNWTAVANDVGITGVRAPWLYTEPNVPMSPAAQMMNFGTVNQSTVPCSVFVYDTTNTRIYSGYGTANVNAGDTARVTFSPQWTPPNRNDVYYEFMATYLAADQNHGNDSAYHEFFGFHVNDPLVARKDSVPVTVDGNIQTAEWAGASKYDVSNIMGWSDPYYRYYPNNCFAYFKHDASHLYVAVEIPEMTADDSLYEIGLYFDENNDGAWAADSSEGNYWAEHFLPTPGDTIVYRALTPSAAWLTTATGALSRTSFASGHLEFEMSLPFGTAKPSLNVNPDNDTLGFYTYVLDDYFGLWVGWWKSTMDAAYWRDPSHYGKLVLTGEAGGGDVGVTEIVAPKGAVDTGATVVPSARVRNNGDVPMDFNVIFAIDSGVVEKYRQSSAVTGLSVGKETTLTFPEWAKPHAVGDYNTLCSLAVFDTGAANNVLRGTFTVQTAPPWPFGWTEVATVPQTPSGKFVKDGGWLAYDASKGLIFAAKGNKTSDFYGFDSYAGAWTEMAPVPPGTEGKPVGKGAAGCADGNGKVYAMKGNSTFGFHEYDVATNAWMQRADVPIGAGKKVKGGGALAWGYKAGVGAVYCLKGGKTEFYRYNPLDSTWTTLKPAPVGAKEKWDKGSWLVSGGSNVLYAHKAKYHELYTYDCDADSWSGLKAGMPIAGSAGTKKSKDGGSAAWLDGMIYAFKGGNTVEFWRYNPANDSWTEKEDIPLIGSTGKKKKVKAGGALAAIPGKAVFGLKGNKSAEFWRYVPATTLVAPAGREGVMASRVPSAECRVTIEPNPLATGFAALRYSLPQPGPARLAVYDVAGRTVKYQQLVLGRSGAVSLDLRHLSAGVYLVKLEAGAFTARQKLVVQR